MTPATHHLPTGRGFLDRWLGDPVTTDLSAFESSLAEIRQTEEAFRKHDDALLKEHIGQLRSRIVSGGALANARTEVFAITNLAAQRCLDLRPTDEQIIAGLALHHGSVVEMPTGEGKTLAAVAPVALNALTGDGAHVLTFNDYLARRDASWMKPVYEALGLSVGCVQDGMAPRARRLAYNADITYLMAREAGFDYLRQFLCLETESLVARDAAFVLVDEADSILIDEARIPLVIAGDVESAPVLPQRLASIVRDLNPELHFDTDDYGHNIFLTEEGCRLVEDLFECGDLFAESKVELLTELRNALHAEYLLTRDVDYIVRNDKIELVDDFTGRVAEKRQWPDGLHAALEAKEGLELGDEGRILGSITMQHFLQTYPTLAGMTATAAPAAEELHDFYGVGVVVVPSHRPCIREDHPDLVFTHLEAKNRAIAADIARIHETGRPILVGTASVTESEDLAQNLAERSIDCRVLNAKNDEIEAEVVAQAGAIGAVTISTNMAGRGTDIRLGGPDGLDHDAVVALGGLHVIGSNRHESVRIDQQLRGRAGRQGDPGSSRFFVSLEDPLIVRYGVNNLIGPKLVPKQSERPVAGTILIREINRAQRIVEGENHATRKRLWEFSHPLETQRRFFQQWRQWVLLDNLDTNMLELSCPDRHQETLRLLGTEPTAAAEKRILLLTIDHCWRDHLELVNHIRNGIHVVGNIGKDPLAEYHREIGQAFGKLRDAVAEQASEAYRRLVVTEEGIDWNASGLNAPASTWTYLVSDSPFGGNVMQTIANRAGIALWGTIILWPVFLMWGLWQHARRWRQR